MANCYNPKLDNFIEQTADDTFITCKNEAEQKFIADTVSEFINQNLDIEINRLKSHLRHNEIHFPGFKLIKSKRSIWILFDNPKEYTARLKRFKFYTCTQCQAFMLTELNKDFIAE